LMTPARRLRRRLRRAAVPWARPPEEVAMELLP
jgi:hypothetical protein